MDEERSTRTLAIVGAIASILVMVGSVGAWAAVTFVQVGEVSFDGLDGDGRWTLGLGVLALVGTVALVAQPRARSWLPWCLALAFGAASVLGVINWTDVEAIPEAFDPATPSRSVDASEPLLVQVGWGLLLMLVGAVGGFLASLLLGLRGAAHVVERRPAPTR